MTGPSFDDLVGEELSTGERARLREAHDALVAAGPPPDLSPALRHPPGTEEQQAEVRTFPGRDYPPRRVVAGLLVAAAFAAASFGAGYYVRGGDEGPSRQGPRFVEVAQLRGESAPNAVAIVQVTPPDAVGNREMVVTVDGLPKLSDDDYYTLFMTNDGKPVVTCGTFNVRGGVKRTTVRLLGAYDPADFEGFALAKYSEATHEDTILLTGDLA